MYLVRRDVDRLDDFADRAGLDQLAGLHRGRHLQKLAVHDAINAMGLGDRLAHLRKLLQRGGAGLVAEEVFTAMHHPHAQRRSLARDGGTENKLYRRIIENRCFGAHQARFREALGKGCHLVRLGSIS